VPRQFSAHLDFVGGDEPWRDCAGTNSDGYFFAEDERAAASSPCGFAEGNKIVVVVGVSPRRPASREKGRRRQAAVESEERANSCADQLALSPAMRFA